MIYIQAGSQNQVFLVRQSTTVKYLKCKSTLIFYYSLYTFLKFYLINNKKQRGCCCSSLIFIKSDGNTGIYIYIFFLYYFLIKIFIKKLILKKCVAHTCSSSAEQQKAETDSLYIATINIYYTELYDRVQKIQ